MFKANNMRVLLVLSVALFVLCSLVDMIPDRAKIPFPCDMFNCDPPKTLVCREDNPIFCGLGEYHVIGLNKHHMRFSSHVM